MNERTRRVLLSISTFLFGFSVCMFMTLPSVEGANVALGNTVFYASWVAVIYLMIIEDEK